MSQDRRATLASLWRYPVKGLAGQALSSAVMTPGETLALDRAYAIENGPGPFDPANPRHLPKIHFLMLMRNEHLAALDTGFEEATQTLTLRSAGGEPAANGDLRTPQGCAAIEDFLASCLPASALRGRPRVVRAPGHSFSDVAAKCVHIVNLESVRALSTILGRPVDARRFRANLYLEGLPAWCELDWPGKTLEGADGLALEVFKRTERCAATNVDPATGARDLNIPSTLSRTLGHTDFGIYARCTSPGMIAVGDTLKLT